MGKACDRDNMVAVLRAKGQQTGDIFSEAERVKNFDAEQRFFYEDRMAKDFGVNLNDSRKPSPLDVIKRVSPKSMEKGTFWDFRSDNLYSHPSEFFSKKFYGSIDKRLGQWQKSGGGIKTYQKEVGQPAQNVLDAVNNILTSGRTKKEMNRELGRFGLSLDTVYQGRDYLEWLSKGGHTNKGKLHQMVQKTGLAKAQANLNILWTMGNSVDVMRVYSHYAAKGPKGIAAAVKGTLDAMKATGGLVSRRAKSLEKSGLYDSVHVDRGGENSDPFSWSVTAQKNLAYHIDKAYGGDGFTGVRETVFDSKPWDQPWAFRQENSGLMYDLARFSINESRWTYKNMIKAVKGDPNAAASLFLYNLGRTAFAGTKTLVPGFLYFALGDDVKESLNEIDDNFGLNAVKQVSRAAFEGIGIDAYLDPSEYLQSFGGNFAVRPGMIYDTFKKGIDLAIKSSEDLQKWNLSAAGVNALAASFAMMNLGIHHKSMAQIVAALQPVNSTTITKLLETTGQELRGEFGECRYYKEILKDLFGVRNVKQEESESGLPKLKRPEGLAKLKGL